MCFDGGSFLFPTFVSFEGNIWPFGPCTLRSDPLVLFSFCCARDIYRPIHGRNCESAPELKNVMMYDWSCHVK